MELIMQFAPVSCSFLLLRPRYLPQHLLSNITGRQKDCGLKCGRDSLNFMC
jgi:hypothetical protein